MIEVFYAKSSHVASVPLQERKIINDEWNINLCLPNESALTAPTLNYLEANRIQLVIQAPYFPGLAPCGFFLFLKVMQQLKGK